MDIYAIGQITQWLVFGKTTKGTHRKRLYEKFNTSRMHFLDSVVDNCLNDDPNNRYQSIEEILEEIEQYNIDKIKVKTNDKVALIEDNSRNIDTIELKNALQDIMNKICNFQYGEYDENTEQTFSLVTEMKDETIKEFLENIPVNLKKLAFFDKVTLSKFINNYQIRDLSEIDKKYFEMLSEMYKNTKKLYPALEPSFIEYVKTRMNKNVEELPF